MRPGSLIKKDFKARTATGMFLSRSSSLYLSPTTYGCRDVGDVKWTPGFLLWSEVLPQKPIFFQSGKCQCWSEQLTIANRLAFLQPRHSQKRILNLDPELRRQVIHYISRYRGRRKLGWTCHQSATCAAAPSEARRSTARSLCILETNVFVCARACPVDDFMVRAKRHQPASASSKRRG